MVRRVHWRSVMRSSFAALAVCALVVGCGSADGGTDPANEPDDSGLTRDTGTPGSDDGGGADTASGSAGDSGRPEDGGPTPVDSGAPSKDSGAPAVDTGTTPTDAGAPSKTPLGKYVMTWYSFQDNTPVNSSFSGSGRKLLPYLSVALPFRLLKPFGGKLAYGDKIHVQFLEGRTMPNGTKHTGWVQIDDFCGDSGDDSYCYQTVGGTKYPNVDLYLGDFTKSGMDTKACSGPAGSGQELTDVSTGTAGSAWIADYGGKALGSGKCGDTATAKSQQGSCWDYTPPASSASECAGCTTSTCTSW